MRNYRVIGADFSFQAENDKIAALVVARKGDYGFVDKNGLELFPATWDESEFQTYLGCPLSIALRDFGPAVASILNQISQ